MYTGASCASSPVRLVGRSRRPGVRRPASLLFCPGPAATAARLLILFLFLRLCVFLFGLGLLLILFGLGLLLILFGLGLLLFLFGLGLLRFLFGLGLLRLLFGLGLLRFLFGLGLFVCLGLLSFFLLLSPGVLLVQRLQDQAAVSVELLGVLAQQHFDPLARLLAAKDAHIAIRCCH